LQWIILLYSSIFFRSKINKVSIKEILFQPNVYQQNALKVTISNIQFPIFVGFDGAFN